MCLIHETMASRGINVDGVVFKPGKTLDELDCQKLGGMVTYTTQLVAHCKEIEAAFQKIQQTSLKKVMRLKKKIEANNATAKIDGYATRLESCMVQLNQITEELQTLKGEKEKLKQGSLKEVNSCLDTEQEDVNMEHTNKIMQCMQEWRVLSNKRKTVRKNCEGVVDELFASQDPALQMVGKVAKLYGRFLYNEKAATEISFNSETAEECMSRTPSGVLTAVAEATEESEENTEEREFNHKAGYTSATSEEEVCVEEELNTSAIQNAFGL